MKNRNLKNILIIYVFAVCILLSSCSGMYDVLFPEVLSEIEDEQKTDEEDTFTIAHYTGEVLNPYTSKSRTNHELLSLCYDGLFTVDASFEPVPVITEKYEIEGNTVNIFIRNDVYFYDKTPVTAYDCVYSYDNAQKQDSVYSTNFNDILSYKALSDYVFQVIFKTENKYNINLLNIPIVKRDASEGYLPIGAGRYYISQKGQSFELLYNPGTAYSGAFEIKEINILNIEDTESLTYYFNYGKIKATYANLSEGESIFRGNNELVSFGTNNLTYLVVNRTKPYLEDIEFSRGLNYMINRAHITNDIMENYAKPVWYPFNPYWSKTVAANLNNDIYSTEAAHECFINSGFRLMDTVRIWEYEEISFIFVVNMESMNRVRAARSISKDLINMGFNVDLRILKWDDYTQAIKNGDFDFYMAEIMLPSNMDINSVLNPDITNNGLLYSEEFLNAVTDFNSGEIDMRTFISIFQTQIPFIPLYFTDGALAVSRNVKGSFNSYDDNIFADIGSWSVDGK